MKPNDRATLTAALREHVAKIAADLRAKMCAPGAARVLAEQLHKDERVAEDFEVWTDLLSRRAAVLWVLKSVYVRVLEDRGLLAPGRLLDPEAQQLFEKLAPNLGETAFLRWIYMDLASKGGGLPELFAPQPAEVVLPSDELSRALIAFWRHRDADTGAVWSFAEERFEGELMGDLYQELDPVVKDRFALCQTPEFVRTFILDRTLKPAIETFGADEVRLLDPACGSGHFLIDGLKRLVAATAEQHADWDRAKVVSHVIDRVVGIDLNDYACALARTRLIMTAAELAGVTKLADAARFHPHVYWADGLEQIERDEVGQIDMFATEKPRAALTRSDVRAVLRNVFEKKFHAVVANPPYITEKDAARRDYHREKVGKKQRYVSAYREYSLGCPFIERCFQLAQPAGHVGVITADSFLKRVFGQPLVEKFFPTIDLTLVVDTSKADVQQADSSTVMLFGRNRRPEGTVVHVVMSKRGETRAASDRTPGVVWTSIAQHWDEIGFEDAYVSVQNLPRALLSKHPWSLEGGNATSLASLIEQRASMRLRDVAEDMGAVVLTRADEVYLSELRTQRSKFGKGDVRPFVTGKKIRDWLCRADLDALFPYKDDDTSIRSAAIEKFLNRYRTLLWLRREPNGNHRETGKTWWEWSRYIPRRHQERRRLIFSNVSTHNQFALTEGPLLAGAHAPIIHLRSNASSSECHAVLGELNSSLIAFWMRQTFHPKGGLGSATGRKRQSEAWARRLEIDTTKLKNAPLVRKYQERVATIAEQLCRLAQSSDGLSPESILFGEWQAAGLRERITAARAERELFRRKMVALQEELDWTIYVAYGLAPVEQLVALDTIEALESSHRPFAIRLARQMAARQTTTYWFSALGTSPVEQVPSKYSATTRESIHARIALAEASEHLAALESPEHKRKWEPILFDSELRQAARGWMLQRIEQLLMTRKRPATAEVVASAVQDDESFLAVLRLFQQRNDIDVSGAVRDLLREEAVPIHPFHVYTDAGLVVHAAWQRMWELQLKEAAEDRVVEIPLPSEYSQGSRGKPVHFLTDDIWRVRGSFDVPRERFIAFTEVPGRAVGETLFGWAGWNPAQRLLAILSIDEELEDQGISVSDRIALLDSAWRLLPDVADSDPVQAARLKAELQAIVGPEGPSRELIGDWKKRFPPPTARAARTNRAAAVRDNDGEDSDTEESAES